jgi:hypothetical protein
MEIQKAPLRSSGPFFTWSRTCRQTLLSLALSSSSPRRAVPGCAGLDVPPEGNLILAATPPPLHSKYEQVFCLNEKQTFPFELGTNKITYLGRHLPSLRDCCAYAAELRTVPELFPEVIQGELHGDGLPSASAAEALDRQEPFVNPTLANHALALLARLFRYGTVSYLSRGIRRTLVSSLCAGVAE